MEKIEVPTELNNQIQEIFKEEYNLDLSRHIRKDSKMTLRVANSDWNSILVVDDNSDFKCVVYLTRKMSRTLKRMIDDT